MRTPSFRVTVLALLVSVCWSSFCEAAAQSRAPTPSLARSYVWGVRRWGESCGSKFDPELTNALAQRMQEIGELSVTLRPTSDPYSYHCQPATCSARFIQVCNLRSGILLGADVETRASQSLTEPEPWTVMRVWRADVATKQLRYADHACRGCNIGSTLARLAGDLIEHPESGGSQVTGRPLLTCASPAAPPAEGALSVKTKSEDGIGTGSGALAAEDGRTYLLIHAIKEQRSHRSEVERSVRQHLRMMGHKVSAADLDWAQFQPGPLNKIVGKAHLGQAMGIQLQKDGQVELRIFDGKSERMSSSTLECLGCASEELTRRITLTAGRLLDQHASLSGSPAVTQTVLHSPEAVCRPLSAFVCEVPEPPPSEDDTDQSAFICPNPMHGQLTPLTPTDESPKKGTLAATRIPPPTRAWNKIAGGIAAAGALALLGLAIYWTATSGTATDGDCAWKGRTPEPRCDAQHLPLYSSSYAGAGALAAGAVLLFTLPNYLGRPTSTDKRR